MTTQKSVKTAGVSFDIYTTSVTQVQQMFASESLRSEDIVNAYMDQIDKHNFNGMNLRGLITVAPRSLALKQARNLDNERKSTGSRGPMHGIPVVVKVVAASDRL